MNKVKITEAQAKDLIKASTELAKATIEHNAIPVVMVGIKFSTDRYEIYVNNVAKYGLPIKESDLPEIAKAVSDGVIRAIKPLKIS